MQKNSLQEVKQVGQKAIMDERETPNWEQMQKEKKYTEDESRKNVPGRSVEILLKHVQIE